MSQHEAFEAFIAPFELKYFTPYELLRHIGKTRGSSTNAFPERALWDNIVPTALILDELRDMLGAPIIIESAYRSPGYNRAIGGAPRSQHKEFRALDFRCTGGTPAEWARMLRTVRGVEFSLPQAIAPISMGHAPFEPRGLEIESSFVFHGGIGVYPTFVHLDTRGVDADWAG